MAVKYRYCAHFITLSALKRAVANLQSLWPWHLGAFRKIRLHSPTFLNRSNEFSFFPRYPFSATLRYIIFKELLYRVTKKNALNFSYLHKRTCQMSKRNEFNFPCLPSQRFRTTSRPIRGGPHHLAHVYTAWCTINQGNQRTVRPIILSAVFWHHRQHEDVLFFILHLRFLRRTWRTLPDQQTLCAEFLLIFSTRKNGT